MIWHETMERTQPGVCRQCERKLPSKNLFVYKGHLTNECAHTLYLSPSMKKQQIERELAIAAGFYGYSQHLDNLVYHLRLPTRQVLTASSHLGTPHYRDYAPMWFVSLAYALRYEQPIVDLEVTHHGALCVLSRFYLLGKNAAAHLATLWNATEDGVGRMGTLCLFADEIRCQACASPPYPGHGWNCQTLNLNHHAHELHAQLNRIARKRGPRVSQA